MNLTNEMWMNKLDQPSKGVDQLLIISTLKHVDPKLPIVRTYSSLKIGQPFRIMSLILASICF